MTHIEIYKQAINDVIFALSSLHGDQKGHFYDKGIRDTLIKLRESAPERVNNEECKKPKTLKEFKEAFENLFLEMKEQVGVVSLEMKECEEYRGNGWSPLMKDKIIKFNINIENS